MTIILVVAGITFVCGIVVYALKIMILGVQIEVFPFLRIMGIETLYNVLISIIIYPLLRKGGDLIERIFTEKKILTREF